VPAALVSAIRVGTIVRVPLHGRRVRGWVLDPDVAAEVDDARLRPVHAVVSAGPSPDVVDLCKWAAWRWAGPLAAFLRAASPPNVVSVAPDPEPETAVYPPDSHAPAGPLVVVAPEREDAALVARLVASEGSTIVLDPDTARSARVVALLEERGREVVSVRSDRAAAELTAGWDRARSGACVIVGGRAAIWAPVPDLARIVVVDEADEALEDERAPTWNARDVAFERVRRARGTIRVVTPAPTVDALVALDAPGDPAPGRERVQWPRATVVDTRDEPPGQALLSGVLADELRRVRDAGRRSVCVLNRRGRARLLACRTCGELARCERCGATVEERDGALACPRCDQTRPTVCLRCHGTRFRAVRPGVNHVRDDLAALLPRASVAAVDASTSALPPDDVLIGTEAVLHRAPRDGTVGLVAFLELDQELLAPRARAAEQALWLLVRAARVLGPRHNRGLLLLQTRVPEHEVVVAARDGQPLIVAEAERARRLVLGWPPFGGVAEVSGAPDAVASACDALRATGRVTVLGPVDGGARALVRAASASELSDALAQPAVDAAHAIGRLRVDVDPRRA
jgi:primosomal protein N' (replication factor Y)